MPGRARPTPLARPGAADWLLTRKVLAGLAAVPKRLSSAYFYDRRGSQLFERICALPEYYLTRTESAIIARFRHEMAACIGEQALLLEPGSGSSSKTRLLLETLPQLAAYVPVDISRTPLLEAARSLGAEYPRIEILPVCADFTQHFPLPSTRRAAARVVIFFPGSTIGNFDPPEAMGLLARLRAIGGRHCGLLIGFDLVKDAAILERAYNDGEGLTAAFNRNVLVRLNREIGADFDPALFDHAAVWLASESRIEMRLVSQRDHFVRIGAERVWFAAGEPLVTEHCHKYTFESFAAQARAAGWAERRSWTDQRGWFCVQYLEPLEAMRQAL